MVKMLDLDRHADCPLWEALASSYIPWSGVRYACLNVLHAYCKVFDKKEIYDLIVRKTCQSCKCPREAHAIYQQQTTNVHERLGFKVVSPADSGVEPRDLGYTWVPPGIRASSRINRFFELIPQDKVPKIGSEGARYREQQIAYQLPKQDLSLEHCKHLEEQHEASFEDFVTARNEIALDIGYVKDAPYDEHCAHCDEKITVGEMVVAAPKFVESIMWHPRCFTCSTCNELLVDLTYCVHEDKIYCERHYAEMLKPRCAGCDEVSLESHAETAVDSHTSKKKEENLKSSQEAEGNASPRASSSPRLRRSPRIDEMDQYEERWMESEKPVGAGSKHPSQPNSPTTPTIEVHSVGDVASWRDEHGLIMQGLSDFYDFTASVNPSRSRSTSRNPSPANSKQSTPLPENTPFRFDGIRQCEGSDQNSAREIGNSEIIATQSITTLIKSFHEEHIALDRVESPISAALNVQELTVELKPSSTGEVKIPDIFVESNDSNVSSDETRFVDEEMNLLIESLRRNQRGSRSHSRSPLPTAGNIERSLESRRSKLIRQNDELSESFSDKCEERVSLLVGEEHAPPKCALEPNEHPLAERKRSRSRSPLPTKSNIERSLEMRRSKLIQYNDELFGKLSDDLEMKPENPSVTMDEQPKNVLKPEESQIMDRKRSRSRSRSPLPTKDNIERSLEIRRNKLIQQNDELFEKLSEDGSIQFEKCPIVDKEPPHTELRLNEREFSGNRSRSRSPLPTKENIEHSLENRRNKLIQHNDELFEKVIGDLERDSESSPTIRIEHAEEDFVAEDMINEDVSSLVASLRVSRTRSRSKSPMRIPNAVNLNESISLRREKLIELNDQLQEHLEQCAHEEPPRVVVEYMYEFEETAEETQDQAAYCADPRSRTPSHSQYPALNEDFEEGMLAEKQRHLDEEALQKLRTASEETELRTLTPLDHTPEDKTSEGSEEDDTLPDLHTKERLQKMRCSPTTPDYDRTISEEWRDVQRIKNEMLSSGFKRSTYVGESMELGSEYEQLRREAAAFRRSRSPSPSIEDHNLENSVGRSRQTAAERRQIQDEILQELILSSSDKTKREHDKHGAKPKTERSPSDEYSRSLSKEIEDRERIKRDLHNSGFQRSTYVGQSVDNNEIYESMRREMAEFRRSRSCSRSPVDSRDNEDLLAIEKEAAKRELQDQILDKLSTGPVSFQDFSRQLNADFLDDRRASDSAVINKPDKGIKYGDHGCDSDMEPEEYHHYRRFSLNQEQQVEEYPDEEFMYISQIEVRSLDGTRTWMREDFYSASVDNSEVSQEGEEGIEVAHDDEETEDSEDERQTVVEVDDEIDTDICDFNERGPTDESHHEQSECEEAERAMDHYANHEATDWQRVSNLGDILTTSNMRTEEEGAVGGMDSDSFEIDQIYDEAIKNRKQSGILREYDSILLEMQENLELSPDQLESKDEELNDQERYALWAKTRNLERGGPRKLSVSFAETEKQDTHEVRYLGNANTTARQSTRLRSRYGYVPQLKSETVDDIEIDVNYKPKREYNWRKNFKLDDDDEASNNSTHDNYENDFLYESKETIEELEDLDDVRKYSLGGESITLFSRSPDREYAYQDMEEDSFETKSREFSTEKMVPEPIVENKENMPNAIEKPKKKKSKKKAHRESKESIENRLRDEDDSDSQIYSRHGSNCSRQFETESPKRKSRSRRGSRCSITNDDSSGFFSPRNSTEPTDSTLNNIPPPDVNEPTKKKVKKRKKVKDAFALSQNIKEEQEQPQEEEAKFKPHFIVPLNNDVTTGETTFESMNFHELNGELRPMKETSSNSTSTTDSAILIEDSLSNNDQTATTITTTVTTARSTARTISSIDSFDILKDASFYPLF